MPSPLLAAAFEAVNQRRRNVVGAWRSRGLFRATHRYGPHPDQVLEVWGPPSRRSGSGGEPGRGAPTLVLLHGGGWIQGSRHAFNSLAPVFAHAGILTIAADYRLVRGDAATAWPAALNDVRAVLRAIPGLGGDPARVVLWGHSAGGHLALLAAAPTTRGVVGLGACVDPRALVDDEAELGRRVFGDQIADASPATRPVPCPVLLVHGEADPVCAVATARAYASREGVTYIEVPGGDHGLRRPFGASRRARAEAMAWALARLDERAHEPPLSG